MQADCGQPTIMHAHTAVHKMIGTERPPHLCPAMSEAAVLPDSSTSCAAASMEL